MQAPIPTLQSNETGPFEPITPVYDSFARALRYLRISVTDRCNYKCQYCMPADEWTPVDRKSVLSLEEIARVVRALAPAGVEKVRLTGGEPLLRKGIVGLVESLAMTPGISEVAMTTNGHLLSRFAADLRQAGLNRLSVSLDTFDEERFQSVTKGGDLSRVLSGLDAAEAAGFDDISVNVVALRNVNDGELGSIAARCLDRNWRPRFIELMPIGGLAFQGEERRVTRAEILAELTRFFGPLSDVERASRTAGPARYYRVQAGPYAGQVLGTISPMTDPHFCGDCNRARLTAQGKLRACLANDDEVSILQRLRSGASDDELRECVAGAMGSKLENHRMVESGFIPLSVMTGIGG